MANHPVQTVAEPGSKAKVMLAIVFAVVGVLAFYSLASQGMLIRTLALVVGLAISVVLFLMSRPGRSLIDFSRQSYEETRKVVWPTRKETTQVTLMVFVFVIVMSLFLWGTDKTLEYLFYDLILGWK